MNSTSKALRALGSGALILLLVFVPFARAQPLGPAWAQLSPTGGPPSARFFHSTVYASATNRMIVFGGQSAAPSGLSFIVNNDVWVLSNANGLGGTPTWMQLSPVGGPPSARSGSSAAYDLATNRMIVFGGQTNPVGSGLGLTVLNDVWVLSNANGLGGMPTWTQLSPAGGPPSARTNSTAVYDPAANRMTVFGGLLPGAFLNDVWVLSNANGLGGTPTWTQLSPAGGPPGARVGHTAVYDPAANRMTVFGGETVLGTLLLDVNDVWVLSNANGLGGTPTWAQLSPAGGPPSARIGHTATYDPATNRMTVFGGTTGTTEPFVTVPPINDVWVLSNANGLGGTPAWTQLSPAGGPPGARLAHTAVYDSATNRMMTFGGVNLTVPVLFNDIWVLAIANGVVSQVPFAAFSAKVDINVASSSFDVNSTFTLGAGGSINPLTQDVTFQLGGFTTKISAGSFQLQKTGDFVFAGIINGVVLEAKISPLSGGSFSFKIDGAGASNLPSANPVAVVLTIGNNTGSISVTADFQ